MKQLAIKFLQLAASGAVAEAFEQHVGQGFKHHNPYFKGDVDSLREAMRENAAMNPGKIFEVQRALQDGDLVAVHSKVRLNEQAKDIALAHLFRFDAGKIIELWDIAQPQPDFMPNQYGMF